MQYLRHFVVDVPESIKGNISTNSGFNLLLSSVSTEDYFKNRISKGVVTSLPLLYKTPVQIGDTIWFHHNVTFNKNNLIYYDQTLYKAQYTPHHNVDNLVYLYKNKKGEYNALNNWLFVEPYKLPNYYKGNLYLNGLERINTTIGKLVYINDTAKELGLQKDQIVAFSKNRDYKIEVDGKTLWRMRNNDVLATIVV